MPKTSREDKSKEQLMAQMAVMRQRIEQLEARHRRDAQTLRESLQQLHQAQKMETLGTLVAGPVTNYPSAAINQKGSVTGI